MTSQGLHQHFCSKSPFFRYNLELIKFVK